MSKGASEVAVSEAWGCVGRDGGVRGCGAWVLGEGVGREVVAHCVAAETRPGGTIEVRVVPSTMAYLAEGGRRLRW